MNAISVNKSKRCVQSICCKMNTSIMDQMSVKHYLQYSNIFNYVNIKCQLRSNHSSQAKPIVSKSLLSTKYSAELAKKLAICD